MVSSGSLSPSLGACVDSFVELISVKKLIIHEDNSWQRQQILVAEEAEKCNEAAVARELTVRVGIKQLRPCGASNQSNDKCTDMGK